MKRLVVSVLIAAFLVMQPSHAHAWSWSDAWKTVVNYKKGIGRLVWRGVVEVFSRESDDSENCVWDQATNTETPKSNTDCWRNGKKHGQWEERFADGKVKTEEYIHGELYE